MNFDQPPINKEENKTKKWLLDKLKSIKNKEIKKIFLVFFISATTATAVNAQSSLEGTNNIPQMDIIEQGALNNIMRNNNQILNNVIFIENEDGTKTSIKKSGTMDANGNMVFLVGTRNRDRDDEETQYMQINEEGQLIKYIKVDFREDDYKHASYYTPSNEENQKIKEALKKERKERISELSTKEAKKEMQDVLRKLKTDAGEQFEDATFDYLAG